MPMLKIRQKKNRDIYSDILAKNKKSLILDFIISAQKNIPAAHDLDEKTLENSLDEFIETLASIISREEVPGVDLFLENMMVSRLHGKSRADIPVYTLDQVINEYRILRCLIFDLLEENLSPLPRIERDKIFFTIDNGVTEAATEFAIRRGFTDARMSA